MKLRRDFDTLHMTLPHPSAILVYFSLVYQLHVRLAASIHFLYQSFFSIPILSHHILCLSADKEYYDRLLISLNHRREL